MEEMQWISSATLRGLIKKANSLHISQSQIVSLEQEGEEWILVYYDEAD